MNRVFIVAEAGVNHNGSVKTAKKLIEAAKDAGADAVKFQTFKARDIVIEKSLKARYQRLRTNRNETQLQMLERLELDAISHRVLKAYCDKKKILFLSTPFDIKSVHFLRDLGLSIFKIPSGEITNLPYLRTIGNLRKHVILSTGMSTLQEVRDALGVLISSGTKKENISLLHCNTEYPTPAEDVNLRAMVTMKRVFDVRIGYSDHTKGIEIPVAAVALGAQIIEKHFTLDKHMEGPDHSASLDPIELKAMITAIRNVENALGDGIKKPSPSEIANRKIIRKSIVAATTIVKGETLSVRNITTKRPGTGVCPMEWDRVIGKTATRNYKKDRMIVL